MAGFLSDLLGTSQENHEQAYGEGTNDAENAGFVESIAHDLGDIVIDTTIFGGLQSSESQSYEAGWHSDDD